MVWDAEGGHCRRKEEGGGVKKGVEVGEVKEETEGVGEGVGRANVEVKVELGAGRASEAGHQPGDDKSGAKHQSGVSELKAAWRLGLL